MEVEDFNLDLNDENDDDTCNKGEDIELMNLIKTREENLQLWNEIEKLNLGQGTYCDLLQSKTLPSPHTDTAEVENEIEQEVTNSNSNVCKGAQAQIRNRILTDTTLVFEHNAWDNVDWSEEMEKEALDAINVKSSQRVEDNQKELLEKDANRFWDKFYDTHQNKFFKDRNWLFAEFPELNSTLVSSLSESESDEYSNRSNIILKDKRKHESYPGENFTFKIFEIGTGVGNTLFPLLKVNIDPNTYFYGCDFSSSAIEILKKNPEFLPDTDRCTVFVMDAVNKDPIVPFPPNTIDIIILIFVLSAISPDKFDQVIKNCYRFLKPGGLVLFRDYGRYDMAQLRFPKGRCIDDNFYVRGDGTRSYFFTEDEVITIFERNGLLKKNTIVDRRLQVNRGKQIKMYRIWIVGKFYKPLQNN